MKVLAAAASTMARSKIRVTSTLSFWPLKARTSAGAGGWMIIAPVRRFSRDLLGAAHHGVERRRGLGPAPIGDDHGAEPRHDAEKNFGQLQRSIAQRDDAVATQRQFQPAAERHAVKRGDYGLGHAIDVQQEPRAVAGVLRCRFRIAEHLWKSADVSAGRESARTITRNDKTAHRGIVFELPDHAE